MDFMQCNIGGPAALKLDTNIWHSALAHMQYCNKQDSMDG